MALGRFLRGLLPGTGSPSGSGPSAGSPPATPAQGPMAPFRPADTWRSVPAIQRTMGPAPLVAPTAAFKANLAAARRAPIALAPLGHQRGLQAPAGLVLGIAAPVQRAAEPVPASVRPPTRANHRGAGGAGPEAQAWEAPRLSDTDVIGSVAWPAFGPGDQAVSPGVPVRQAPVVSPAAPPASLVRAPSPTPAPSGRVGSHAVVAREAATAPSGPAAPAPIPGTPGPGTPAAPGLTAAGLRPMTLAASGITAPPPDTGMDSPRPNLGQSRRLRVGPPITPVTGPPVAREVASGPTAPSPTPQPGPAPLPAPARPATGHHPLVDESADARRGGWAADVERTAEGPEPEAPMPAVSMRLLSVARSVDAPLVGTLRPQSSATSPAVAIHMQAERDEGAGPMEGSPEAALAALGRFDQSAGIGIAGSMGPRESYGAGRPSLFPGASAAGVGGIGGLGGFGGRPPVGPGPTVSRSLAAPSSPSIPARSPASALPVGGQARTIIRGAGPSDPGLPMGAGMRWDPVNGLSPTPFVQGEAAGGSPSVSSGGTGLSVAAPSAPARPFLAPLVARDMDDPGSGPGAPLQREGAGGGTSAASGEAGAGAPAGGAIPEAQLDDLARRLHDRISSRISRDLLVERERAGSLIDRGW